MGAAADIVTRGMQAWEQNDEATLSSLVNDNFVLSGPVPQPLGKQEFIGMMKAMLTAFPDFKFNGVVAEEREETVVVKARISGTHTGTLALPGLPPIPATGKKISLAEERQEFTLVNGKLSKLTTDSSPDAGVPGMLAQLGVPLPG